MVVQGKCSQWVHVKSDTPEVGLLFACIVNDLPEAIQTETLMFADNIM